MSRATEKCGCGASIDVTSETSYGLRLALEQWREGHQHHQELPGTTEWAPPGELNPGVDLSPLFAQPTHESNGEGPTHGTS